VTTFAAPDGVQLHYTCVGQGPPLVCLPGGPGRAVAYLEDLAGLGELRALVLLDPRATGRSEVPPDPASLRFDRMADDLEALRAHLGLEALDVLAHSAGTLVAQAWASRFPAHVGHLVLVTPSGHLQGCARSDVASIREQFADEPWYDQAAAAQAELDDAPPSQRAALERETRPFMYGTWDARTQAHAASADTQSSKRAVLGFGTGLEPVEVTALVDGLREVTAPVLVVGGARDALTGLESVLAVAGSFPTATTAVVPGAGHFPWVDEPAGFRAAVDPFLQG
jgi:proline iminopeptidase